MTLYELTTLDKLNEAYEKCAKVSRWKEGTQKYRQNLLINNTALQDEVRNGTYKTSPTNGFEICERGKTRHIEAPAIRDRVIQKVLCKYILVPKLSKSLIYDNYASLKNRGTSFARKRVEVMLRRFLREHKDGYILQIDIKRYFNSIDHDVLKEMVHKKIHEPPDVMNLIDHIIDSSMDTGLNLGSEAPQIFAIYYLNTVDTYAKTVKRAKYYGRYMDDIFIFSDSKEELRDILSGIREQLKLLRLEINDRKTHITKLRRGFTFLQIKYNIDGTKIVKRPTHAKIARERRRLKKYRLLYDNNVMSELEIRNAYRSWRNCLIKDCNACKRTIRSTDKLYRKLFPEREIYIKQGRESLIQSIFRKEQQWILDHVQ